jgi:NAD(P)-dependent dehydrogenase (short-subunit alcohol dehydrogenase family)
VNLKKYIPLNRDEIEPVAPRFRFDGKKAFVTGGARGIGSAAALALAELGADVAIVDIRHEIAKETADFIHNKFGRKTIAVKCDVSVPEEVNAMIKTVSKELGGIDCVFSNAGVAFPNDIAGDMPYEDYMKMVKINLVGMFLVNQAAARYMKEQGKGGAIVNTASMNGHIVPRMPGDVKARYCSCYNSCKAGVLQLTKSMAMDFCQYNIRFNSISPGYFCTDATKGDSEEISQVIDSILKNVPMKRFGTLNEIGGLVAFLLSDLASFMTGTDVVIDGGYTVW